MRWWVATAAVLAGLAPVCAAAGDWRALDGPAIRTALTARVLSYPDGTLQDFFADGRTLRGDAWGMWRVEGARLCTVFPPGTDWTCADVSARGLDLRFTGDEGAAVIGRYVDLN